jgi:predicted nuclease with TOPRIM domain
MVAPLLFLQVNEECQYLRETLSQVEEDCQAARAEVGHLQAKVKNLEQAIQVSKIMFYLPERKKKKNF